MSLTVTGTGVTGSDYTLTSNHTFNSTSGKLYTFTGTKAYTITPSATITDMYIWLVGGGGGGGQGSEYVADGFNQINGVQGAGGGGGGVINGYRISSFSGGTFTVGAGGLTRSTGSNTTIIASSLTYIGRGGNSGGDGNNGSARGIGGTANTAGTTTNCVNGALGSGISGGGVQPGVDGAAATIDNTIYLGGGGASGNLDENPTADGGLSNYGGGGKGGDGFGTTNGSFTGGESGQPGVIYVWFASAATPAPTTPASLSSSSVLYNGFTVTWSGASGATSYTYTLNGTTATPSSQTSTSATFSGLDPDTNYAVIVYAVNAGGNTPSSSFTIRTSSGGTVPDGGLNGPTPCFLQGSKILCSLNDQDTYVPIEQMRPGTLVKTSDNSYRRVKFIGYSAMVNPGSNERIEKRIYVCRKQTYPELEDDLYLTGNHSILVSRITDEEKEQLLKNLGDIFVTAGKYRLVTFIDKRSEPWASEGKYTVWHLALESNNEVVNYGVYANGLLVETACIQTLRDKSGMTFL
jgi:hypothetical protein